VHCLGGLFLVKNTEVRNLLKVLFRGEMFIDVDSGDLEAGLVVLVTDCQQVKMKNELKINNVKNVTVNDERKVVLTAFSSNIRVDRAATIMFPIVL